jgi:hypothetical protein
MEERSGRVTTLRLHGNITERINFSRTSFDPMVKIRLSMRINVEASTKIQYINSIITPIFIGSQQTQHVELHKGSLDDHVRQLTRPKHEAHGREDNHLATAMDP